MIGKMQDRPFWFYICYHSVITRLRLMVCSCLKLNFVRPRDVNEEGREGK